jgi:kynurenine formamidase
MSRRLLQLFLVIVASAALVLAAAAYGAASNRSSPPMAKHRHKTITYSRVVDLSHVISPDIPLWPGDPPVVFTDVATFINDGYFLRKFEIGEHSATHMNAANSFIDGNTRAITSYPARQRVVKAVVIDVRARCAADADYQLSLRDVRHWEARHGKIAKGSFVVMFTGWEAKWSDPAAFINQDAEGNLHFPGFAAATTDWLVKARGIAGVGIDTHGVDPGLDTSYATNTEMAQTHKIAIECMANLDKLPPKGATLILAPLQLQGGSGSPMDIVALVP